MVSVSSSRHEGVGGVGGGLAAVGGRQAVLGGRAVEGCLRVGAESAAIWASHGRRVSPLPLPSPAWLAAPGGGEGRSGLRDHGWTVLYSGTGLCGLLRTAEIARGGKEEGRCEFGPEGVSVNRSLAKGT